MDLAIRTSATATALSPRSDPRARALVVRERRDGRAVEPAQRGYRENYNHPGSSYFRFRAMRLQAHKKLHFPHRAMTDDEMGSLSRKLRANGMTLRRGPVSSSCMPRRRSTRRGEKQRSKPRLLRPRKRKSRSHGKAFGGIVVRALCHGTRELLQRTRRRRNARPSSSERPLGTPE